MIVAILLLLLIGYLFIKVDVEKLISVTSAAFIELGIQEDAQLSPSGTTLNYRRGSVPSYFCTSYPRYP